MLRLTRHAPGSVLFVKFLLVGALNTIFSWAIFALLIVAGLPYALATFLATVAGILFNFKTYGTLVFRSHDNGLIFRFFAVYALIYAVNLAPLEWAQRHGVSLVLTGMLMAPPSAVAGFLLNRYFVFGRRR